MIHSKLIENSNDYFAIFCSTKFVLLICIITIITIIIIIIITIIIIIIIIVDVSLLKL